PHIAGPPNGCAPGVRRAASSVCGSAILPPIAWEAGSSWRSDDHGTISAEALGAHGIAGAQAEDRRGAPTVHGDLVEAVAAQDDERLAGGHGGVVGRRSNGLVRAGVEAERPRLRVAQVGGAEVGDGVA